VVDVNEFELIVVGSEYFFDRLRPEPPPAYVAALEPPLVQLREYSPRRGFRWSSSENIPLVEVSVGPAQRIFTWSRLLLVYLIRSVLLDGHL
jgi:hypothetical protein